jgi:pSer/pThr/pTyr-binding forkhead associated (FHA) protein
VTELAAASIAVDEALLALKIAFLVLLYLFIWRIVRAAARDVSAPQESVIIRPNEAAALGLVRQRRPARLVVIGSPALEPGRALIVDSTPVSVGRAPQNDVALDGDEFASAQHARFELRRDGLWVEDLGSTNGTYVNGARLGSPRLLIDGDVVRVGRTDFRVEAA